MKNIHGLQFKNGSREELLPGFSPDFPYIASYAELDKYIDRYAPWHWHREVELFYMEKGVLEYSTPGGKMIFPTGSCGFVNSNVLHMTKPQEGARDTTQLIHIFDPILISGQQGSRIEQKYVTPLVAAPEIEIIGLYPENKNQEKLISLLRQSFENSEDCFSYEINLREDLSKLWCGLLDISMPLRESKNNHSRANEKIKQMLICIHERFTEKISIGDIASAAYISERECFRVFHDNLHTTPLAYLKSYRLQKACHLLAETDESLTYICNSCALGSSSFFGKTFREHLGCTPLEYRSKWQNNDTNRQK